MPLDPPKVGKKTLNLGISYLIPPSKYEVNYLFCGNFMETSFHIFKECEVVWCIAFGSHVGLQTRCVAN